jgi:hypothetical protein
VTEHCVASLESKHQTSKSRYKPEAITLTVNISDVYICSSARQKLFSAATKKPLKIIQFPENKHKKETELVKVSKWHKMTKRGNGLFEVRAYRLFSRRPV